MVAIATQLGDSGFVSFPYRRRYPQPETPNQANSGNAQIPDTLWCA
jgi:hypothetical protein